MRAARIVLDEPTVIPKGWCWRDDWVTGHDSAYGLLSKFASLNMMGARELAQLFASRQRGQRKALIKAPAIDLRTSAMFDQQSIGRTLRLPDMHLRRAFLHDPVVQGGQKSSAVLRWCPACAHSGLHSAIFQFDFVNVCPTHDEPVRSRCPNCEATIPYRLQPDVFSKPFCCPACGFDLAPLLRDTTVRSLTSYMPDVAWMTNVGEALAMEKAFLSVKIDLNRQRRRDCLGDILFARNDWRRPASQYAGFVHEVLSCLDGSTSRTPGSLSQSSIAATTKRPPGKPMHTALAVKSSGRKPKPASQALPLNPKNGWDIRLQASYTTYAAIRRYLWRHAVRAHRACILKVARHLTWRVKTGDTGCHCPVAEAFLRWRMHWEGTGTPRHLSTPQIKPPSGLAGWMGADAPICPPGWTRQAEQWAADHVLGMHCLATFDEFFELAKRHLHEQSTEWRASGMLGTHTSYWAMAGRDTEAEPIVFYRSVNAPYRFPLAASQYPGGRVHRRFLEIGMAK